jgi:hypothetical protein
MPTAEVPAAEAPKAQAQTPHIARIISSDSIPAGGFTPGTILADRYRIIGLLGRGGDPLAAALAAGETPSPEMLAASGGKEGLRPTLAWVLLVFIIAGTPAILAMNDRSMLHRRIPFENSPEILAERSRQFLKKMGHSDKLT